MNNESRLCYSSIAYSYFIIHNSNYKTMADNTEILRRRTFAIIAHTAAGKTSLTEKLLLFGGQIQVAGAVKSNKIK